MGTKASMNLSNIQLASWTRHWNDANQPATYLASAATHNVERFQQKLASKLLADPTVQRYMVAIVENHADLWTDFW